MYTAEQCYELTLLMLCIWREARGEPSNGQYSVAWVIKNRVQRGGWFGKSWVEVITKPSQFSSFNTGDPNAAKFPDPLSDPAYGQCLLAAKHVYDGTAPDPTGGSTYYFDDSIAGHPPAWADGFVPTVKVGRLHFFRDK